MHKLQTKAINCLPLLSLKCISSIFVLVARDITNGVPFHRYRCFVLRKEYYLQSSIHLQINLKGTQLQRSNCENTNNIKSVNEFLSFISCASINKYMVLFDNSFIACMYVVKYVELTRPWILSVMKSTYKVSSEMAEIQYRVWH